MRFLKTSNYIYIQEVTPEQLMFVRRILCIESEEFTGGGKTKVIEEFLIQEENEDPKFFTGLLELVNRNLPENSYELLDFEDKKIFDFIQFDETYLPGIILRDDQVSSIRKCLRNPRGIVDLPTRTGKTEIFSGIVKLYQENVSEINRVLILEDGVRLMHQTAERFKKRGIKSVGRLGDKKYEIDEQVVVCTIDSLYSYFQKEESKEFIKSVKVVIIDEVQHLAAQSYKSIVSTFEDLDILLGFSGTPLENRENPFLNPRDAAIIGCLHKTVVRISSQYFIDAGIISEPNVFFLNYDFKRIPVFIQNYQKVYDRFMVNNQKRNEVAVNIVKYCQPKDLSILLSVRIVNHGKVLLSMLKGLPKVVFSFGGNTNISNYSKELESLYSNKISDIIYEKDFETKFIYFSEDFDVEAEINSKRMTTLIGSSVFDEGRDIPNLDGIVLLAGGASHVKTIQRPARALTRSDTRTKSFIVDFEDDVHAYLKAHSKKRKQLYINNSYKVFQGSADLVQFLNNL